MSHDLRLLLTVSLLPLLLSGKSEGGAAADAPIRDGVAESAQSERNYKLPEVVVKPKKRQVLRLMGYVREYSTMTTYTDTVFLFREKTVDFMVPVKKVAKKFKGWTNPRVLASKSYYRFTNSEGLDSVSNYFGQYFSWSDWIGLVDRAEMPLRLRDVSFGTDTVRGCYGPVSVWSRDDDKATFEVDILADSVNGKWVSDLSVYMRGRVNFDKFSLRYDFSEISGGLILADNISKVTAEIESKGRGRDLPRFIHSGGFDVSTRTEIYITDRKYMSLSEAGKWRKEAPSADEIGIVTSADVPAPAPEIQALKDRVNNIDFAALRAAERPNEKYASMKSSPTDSRGSGIKNFLKSGAAPKRSSSPFPSRGM